MNQTHKVYFWIDPLLTYQEDWLKVYVDDLNVIFQPTSRRFTYGGASIQPYVISPAYYGQYTHWYELNRDYHVIIKKNDVNAAGEGYADKDSNGNSICMTKFSKIYNPLEKDEQYWNTQLRTIAHEFCHGYGAGDMYLTFSANDPSGIDPIDNLWGGHFWDKHPDWKDDIMVNGLNFSTLTKTILDHNWRTFVDNEFPNLGVPISDINNIKLTVKDKNGLVVKNASVKIWKQFKGSGQPVLYADIKTDDSGVLTYSWGQPDNDNAYSDSLHFILVEKDDVYEKLWISFYELQYDAVVNNNKTFSHVITMNNYDSINTYTPPITVTNPSVVTPQPVIIPLNVVTGSLVNPSPVTGSVIAVTNEQIYSMLTRIEKKLFMIMNTVDTIASHSYNK